MSALQTPEAHEATRQEVSDPFEEPGAPEVVVQTDRESVVECVDKIMTYLSQNGGLTRPVELHRIKAGQAEFLQRLLDQGWSWEVEQSLISEDRRGAVKLGLR